jgi:hypothetical protein
MADYHVVEERDLQRALARTMAERAAFVEGMGVAALSYVQALNLGVFSDPDVCPDVQVFCGGRCRHPASVDGSIGPWFYGPSSVVLMVRPRH